MLTAKEIQKRTGYKARMVAAGFQVRRQFDWTPDVTGASFAAEIQKLLGGEAQVVGEEHWRFGAEINRSYFAATILQ